MEKCKSCDKLNFLWRDRAKENVKGKMEQKIFLEFLLFLHVTLNENYNIYIKNMTGKRMREGGVME